MRSDLIFLFYRYLGAFHRDPVDFDDLFDGMRNLAAESAVQEAMIEDG